MGKRILAPWISSSFSWAGSMLPTRSLSLCPMMQPSRFWLHVHRRPALAGVSYLVLDQFEEVFTVGSQRAGTEEEVCAALGIVVQGAVPESVARCLVAEETFFDYFDPESQPVRVIPALRDDYVYALNRWRRHLPQLGQNYFELRALRGPAVFDAV